MAQKLFNVARDCHRLEEAIEYILNEDAGSDVSYDLVTIPLIPSVFTDEEADYEDNIHENIVSKNCFWKNCSV